MKLLMRFALLLFLLLAALGYTYFGPPQHTAFITHTSVYKKYILPLFDRLLSAMNSGAMVVGQVAESRGDVKYQPQTELSFIPAHEGQRLLGRTLVATGDKSEAVIQLPDDSILKLAPNSTVLLDVPQDAKDLSFITLTLVSGSVDAKQADGSKLDLKIKNTDGSVTQVGKDGAKVAALAKKAAEEAALRKAEAEKQKAIDDLIQAAKNGDLDKLLSPEDAARWKALSFEEQVKAFIKLQNEVEKAMGPEEMQRLMQLNFAERVKALQEKLIAQGMSPEEAAKVARVQALALEINYKPSAVAMDERSKKAIAKSGPDADYFPEEIEASEKAQRIFFTQKLGASEAERLMGLSRAERQQYLQSQLAGLQQGSYAAAIPKLTKLSYEERSKRLGGALQAAALDGAGHNLEFAVGAKEARHLGALSLAKQKAFLGRQYHMLVTAYGKKEAEHLWNLHFDERVAVLLARNAAIAARAGKENFSALRRLNFERHEELMANTQAHVNQVMGIEESKRLLDLPFAERLEALTAKQQALGHSGAGAEKSARLEALALERAHVPSRTALDSGSERTPASEKQTKAPDLDVPKEIKAHKGGLSSNWAPPPEEYIVSRAVFAARVGHTEEARRLLSQAIVSDNYSRRHQFNDATQVALGGILESYVRTGDCAIATDTYRNIQSYFGSDPQLQRFRDSWDQKIQRMHCR